MNAEFPTPADLIPQPEKASEPSPEVTPVAVTPPSEADQKKELDITVDQFVQQVVYLVKRNESQIAFNLSQDGYLEVSFESVAYARSMAEYAPNLPHNGDPSISEATVEQFFQANRNEIWKKLGAAGIGSFILETSKLVLETKLSKETKYQLEQNAVNLVKSSMTEAMKTYKGGDELSFEMSGHNIVFKKFIKDAVGEAAERAGWKSFSAEPIEGRGYGSPVYQVTFKK